MFIRAKPDSLSVVMVVRKYPLTSFKVLFARSSSAEVTGMVQAIRSKQLMLGIMLGSQAWWKERDKDHRHQFNKQHNFDYLNKMDFRCEVFYL